MELERGGQRLHFEVYGRDEAPPLLLIMGLGVSSGAWGALPGRLAQKLRVITFDNRGTGRSRPLARSRFGIGDMADDAAAVLEAAGVRRAGVFGISMGGMIAEELALRHPARVSALALGATLAGFRGAKRPRLRTLFEYLTAYTRKDARGRGFERVLVSPAFTTERPRAFERWLAIAEPTPLPVTLRQFQAVIGHDTAARLGQIRVPTLVVAGTSDRLIPVDNSRALAKAIAGARLLELSGAGHLFVLERAEETVAAIERHFLEAAAGAQSAAV